MRQGGAKRFEDFWIAYPRKRDKGKALTAWKKHKCDESADRIIEDVHKRAEIEWAGKEPQFIPYPATYLNGERWHDDIEDNRNAKGTRTGGNHSRAKQVADRLDSIIRDGLPEERAERMGGGDLSEAAGGVRKSLDGEYRRH